MMDKLQLVRSMKSPELANHNISVLGLSSSLFSEDMMTEIFFWLPLKSLIRFKRLSKKWYSLITDQDSNFRRNYLSTLSSRKRNRIVESSDDDDDDDDDAGIMAGFFSLKPLGYWKSNEPVRFLPRTCTQLKKYSFLPPQGGISSPTTTTTTTTTEIININKINPFLSFEESLDKFFSARLHEDEENYPLIDDRKIFVCASSNGFLFCTLYSGFSHITDYLVNPVTMEWLALPQLGPVEALHIGFVCKGDYPSLDLAEYTIVRLSWLEESVTLLLQLFSSASASGGDNEWSEYRVSCDSLPVKFDLWGQHDTMIVSTTTNNQGGGGGGGSRRILVYFLVTLWRTRTTAIVVVELNEGDDQPLQVFETPGGPRDPEVRAFCGGADYLREFDDGRVIHYVRFSYLSDFEFWVLNTESGEWFLKHRTNLWTMLLSNDYDLGNVMKWTNAPYHIHGFHPMNPNLVFLTLYGKFACFNVKTGMFEVVYDFGAQNMKYNYSHFVYQWPCWPPLL